MSQNTSTRRKFLGMTGLMGAGAVLSSCASVVAASSPKSKKNLDAVILNFALNLEYLEAAFYLAAVGKLDLLDSAGGNSAMVTMPDGFTGKGWKCVDFSSPAVAAYAEETAMDELNHVKVIRSVLGSAAVSQPQLNLSTSFSTAGEAASGGRITGFNPFASELLFLHGAFIFEDVGVSAYKGAARFLVDDTAGGNLENAAGILAVEAYHAGMIRTLLYARKDVVVVPASGAMPALKVSDVVQAISNLRDSVDNTAGILGAPTDDDDQGIVPGAGNPSYVTGASNIIPTDVNSIAFSRTPRNVANIVQLNKDAANMPYSFFPNGLSGNTVTGDYSSILAL